MNLSDADNYMGSPNLHSFARDMGWWDPQRDGEFDFMAAYGYQAPSEELARLYSLYAGRRFWRIISTAAPSQKFDPKLGLAASPATYPFSVEADGPMSLHDITSLMRDYFQGTEYDMSKGVGAGPFESPLRYDGPGQGVKGAWERSIYIFR